MNELTFRCVGADLPMFCQKCGLVESHEVHHGGSAEWSREIITAHKFKEARNGTHNRPSAQ